MRPWALLGLYIYLASVAAIWTLGRDVVSYILTTAVDMAIYGIVVLSLNLEAGIGGIPNFGKVLTFTAGAFVAGGLIGRIAVELYGVKGDYVYDNPAILSALTRVMTPEGALLLLVLALIASAVVGAAIGAAMSLPAARLREDYLAITLLAFGDFLYYIGRYYDPLVGGTLGVSTPPVFEKLFGGGTSRYIGAAILLGAVAAAVYFALQKLANSPFGRALRVHREDPELAEVFGRNAVSLRLWAMAIGGATAAVAGSLYVFYVGAVNASSFTRINYTFYPWLMMILGGMGNNSGAINGVFIFVTMYRAIDINKYEIAAALGFDPVWLAYILFGALALAVISTRPQGIVPEEVKPLLPKTHKQTSGPPLTGAANPPTPKRRRGGTKGAPGPRHRPV